MKKLLRVFLLSRLCVFCVCGVSVKCSGGLKVIQENERIPTYRT